MISESLKLAQKKYYEKNKSVINQKLRDKYNYNIYLDNLAERHKSYRKDRYEKDEIYREKSKEFSKNQYAHKLIEKERQAIMLILIDN